MKDNFGFEIFVQPSLSDASFCLYFMQFGQALVLPTVKRKATHMVWTAFTGFNYVEVLIDLARAA